MDFSYTQPTKIEFGAKKIDKLPSIVKQYGKKVLIIGPYLNEFIQPMFDRVLLMLETNDIEVVTFFEVEPNPSTTTVDKAMKIAKENCVDALIAMGGGSTIDTSKIVGLCYGLDKISWKELFNKYDDFTVNYPPITDKTCPVIAIPTTAGTGSQCTQASVITDDESKMKLTVFHQDNYARVAIIDPELALTLPEGITVSTAFDAFTHSFESYLRNESNPIAEMMSFKSIRMIVENLPKVLKENKVEFREQLSLADTFGGIALANCGAALPHPLSEIIGSIVNKFSHGQALALVYPTFIKHTYLKYEHKYAEVCRIFDSTYINKSDQEAAKDFHNILLAFMKENNLKFELRDFVQDEDSISEIINCPVWEHLSMERTDTIKTIVKEICQ